MKAIGLLTVGLSLFSNAALAIPALITPISPSTNESLNAPATESTLPTGASPAFYGREYNITKLINEINTPNLNNSKAASMAAILRSMLFPQLSIAQRKNHSAANSSVNIIKRNDRSEILAKYLHLTVDALESAIEAHRKNLTVTNSSTNITTPVGSIEDPIRNLNLLSLLQELTPNARSYDDFDARITKRAEDKEAVDKTEEKKAKKAKNTKSQNKKPEDKMDEEKKSEDKKPSDLDEDDDDDDDDDKEDYQSEEAVRKRLGELHSSKPMSSSFPQKHWKDITWTRQAGESTARLFKSFLHFYQDESTYEYQAKTFQKWRAISRPVKKKKALKNFRRVVEIARSYAFTMKSRAFLLTEDMNMQSSKLYCSKKTKKDMMYAARILGKPSFEKMFKDHLYLSMNREPLPDYARYEMLEFAGFLRAWGTSWHNSVRHWFRKERDEDRALTVADCVRMIVQHDWDAILKPVEDGWGGF